MIGHIDKDGKYTRQGFSHAVVDSSQYKAGEHDRQRQDHMYELIQPYENGAPNDEFVEAYPEEAKLYGFVPGEEDV